MKTIKIYNTLMVTVMNETMDWPEAPEEYCDEIINAIEADDVDLAEYSDMEKLQRITMSTEFYNGKLYGLATCVVDDDWNDSDTTELKEYLSGQYSDGWGEGFEQREIATWYEDEEYEEYDEENDEYYVENYPVKYYAYVNFWQGKNFKIMTENELKN